MKPFIFVPFCSLALVLAVVAVEACSSSSSDGGGAQTGLDASTGGGNTDGGGPGSSLVMCGPPPYITLGLVVEQASTTPNPPRIGGAVLTSALCPDASFTSDDDGGIVGLVTKGVPFYGQFNASGYAPTLSPEENFAGDTSDVAIALPPSLLSAIIPNYDKTKTVIFLAVRKDTGTSHDGGADCTDVSGVSVAVTGHPEAVVTYYTNDAIPAAMPAATSTSTGGSVSVTGIDVSASPVTVTATKPGCTVTLLNGSATGRLPLENGYVSIAAAYLRN
ncbi:MAG: hypothetical protein ABI461_14870 [Polyangiaceae bacterium]